MKPSLQAVFFTDEKWQQELLIAQLAEEGFDAFEEKDDCIIACGETSESTKAAAMRLAESQNIKLAIELLASRNWNAEWEASYEPVVVEGFCTIRAAFHKPAQNTKFELVITPKMSFGTGHHATTQLMVAAMQHLPLQASKVLDFGTGTGVLAILSKKMGADTVIGNDIEEWTVENAKENAVDNACANIDFRLGSLDVITEGNFDCILANINLNVLLGHMQQLADKLETGGTLLLSGILETDKDEITEAATIAGFQSFGYTILNGWMAVKMMKP